MPTTAARFHVVWFKRDLRIHDHAPLAEAARAAAEGGAPGGSAGGTGGGSPGGMAWRGTAVLPLYIVEPGLWRQPDYAWRHWAFIADSLTELRRALGGMGVPLVVRTGAATDVLEAIRRSHGIAALWSHQETGNLWTFDRDKAVAAWARGHGIPWHQPRQHGVIRGLKSRDGWAQKWDRFMGKPQVPTPDALPPLSDGVGLAAGPIPTAADLGLAEDGCSGRQPGGRAAGLATLHGFLEERGQEYQKRMSSPVTAFDACSRLSPHLAWGTLSMREVAQETEMRQVRVREAGEKGWGAALKAFSGRLRWHCHFMQKLEDAPEHEVRNIHRMYDGLREAEFDPRLYDAWCRGETGFPFVDACMRALTTTGYMNFRMRAMLCAFSSYHLWLHWRAPGLHLARMFTDYEPGIHWSQMQMQSGTTGINTLRIYNPVKQSQDQDPEGRFIRHWLPELAGVPDKRVHEPWKMTKAEQRDAGCTLGEHYPMRVIDHQAAARHARDRVYGVRKDPAFRDQADAIQHKHGSRKSGLPPSNPSKRRKSSNAAAAGQGAFDFGAAGD